MTQNPSTQIAINVKKRLICGMTRCALFMSSSSACAWSHWARESSSVWRTTSWMNRHTTTTVFDRNCAKEVEMNQTRQVICSKKDSGSGMSCQSVVLFVKLVSSVISSNSENRIYPCGWTRLCLWRSEPFEFNMIQDRIMKKVGRFLMTKRPNSEAKM